MPVDKIKDENYNIGDLVIYCPFYVKKYKKTFEGIVLEVSRKSGFVKCQLGFGKKWCNPVDLAKIKTQTNVEI